ATHFTEAHQPFIRFDFNNGPHKPAPMAAVRVTQRRLERHGHGGRFDVDDLHRYARLRRALAGSVTNVEHARGVRTVIDSKCSLPCTRPNSLLLSRRRRATAVSRKFENTADTRRARRW